MALHWSERGEEVKKLAGDLSKRWKHHYLSTEHYFYACCQVDGECSRWLSRRGFSLATLEEDILRWVPEGDEVPIWDGMVESPRLRRIVTKLCQEEAESQKSMRIEPKHVVAAILSEGGGIAARILREKDNDLKACRAELLGGASAPTQPVATSGGRAGGAAEAPREAGKAANSKEKFLNK